AARYPGLRADGCPGPLAVRLPLRTDPLPPGRLGAAAEVAAQGALSRPDARTHPAAPRPRRARRPGPGRPRPAAVPSGPGRGRIRRPLAAGTGLPARPGAVLAGPAHPRDLRSRAGTAGLRRAAPGAAHLRRHARPPDPGRRRA